MQFLTQNPAISAFQTGVRAGDEERRMDEEHIRSRLALENQLGSDKALREGIGAFYAQQPVAAQPAAPVAPAAPPKNVAIPVGPTMEEGPTFAVAPGAPQPAAAPATPAPRAQRPSFEPVIQKLAGTPGTGQAMMNLFSTDLRNRASAAEQDRRIKAEGAKEAFAALKAGNPRLARAINQQFGLGIPDGAWESRDFNAAMLKGAGIAKAYGLKDEHGPTFLRAYVETYSKAVSQNVDPQQAEQLAMQSAVAAMPTNSFKVKQYITSESGEVMAMGEHPGQTQPTGVKARKTASQIRLETGGRPSATIQNRDDAERRLKLAFPGIDDQTVNKLVMMGSRAFISPSDYARIENNLAKLTDRSGKPIYKTPEERKAAARTLVEDARKAAGVLAQATQEDQPAPQSAANRRPLSSFER